MLTRAEWNCLASPAKAANSDLFFPMAKLLIVEDDEHLRDALEMSFRDEGFIVVTATCGEAALKAALTQKPQLMILDVMLPGIDGFEVCRRIGGRVPVIMLTARDELPDRIAGLELGADDYIVKPFSPRELAARVTAVLRRRQGSPAVDDVVELGPVTLARGAREVRVNGGEVELTQREFDLLEFLLRHAGQVHE